MDIVAVQGSVGRLLLYLNLHLARIVNIHHVTKLTEINQKTFVYY